MYPEDTGRPSRLVPAQHSTMHQRTRVFPEIRNDACDQHCPSRTQNGLSGSETAFQAFVLAAQLEDHAVCQRIIQSSWSGRLIGGSWLVRWGHPSAKNDKDLFGRGDPNGRIFDFATISEYQLSLLPRHVLWALLRASGVAQEQRFADDVTRSQLMAVEYTRLMKLRGMPFLCLVSTKPIGQELVANQTEDEAKR